MTLWLRRVRAVIGLGLLWALGGLALGGLVELVDNVLPAAHAFTRRVDMWPQLLALLAFPRGVVFACVVGLARGHRRFEELSLAQFAGWGALAGLLMGAVALVRGSSLAYVAVTTLLCALAGAGSLALARLAERRATLAAGTDRASLGAGAIGEVPGRKAARGAPVER